MKLIPLHNRKKEVIAHARISDEDFELVSQYSWNLKRTPSGGEYARAYAGGGRKNRKHIYLHRLIMDEHNPKVEIDHSDNWGLNCERPNLRIATSSQQKMNRRKLKGTSIYLGVSFDKRSQRWIAEITVNGKHIYIGSSKYEVECAKMRDVAALKYHGVFASLNFTELQATGT